MSKKEQEYCGIIISKDKSLGTKKLKYYPYSIECSKYTKSERNLDSKLSMTKANGNKRYRKD